MTTQVGIFGRTQRPEIKSLGDGVAAYGDRPIFQNPDAWKAYQAKPDRFDLIIVNGFSGPGQGIADYYRQYDIPVFVIEQGHIRRGEYHQLGFEHLNWLPDKADSKRREALGIEKPRLMRARDGYVLALGQKPGDAQLGCVDIHKYLSEKIEGIRRHILYRPHPLDTSGFVPQSATLEPGTYQLDESFAGAHSVVTFNSNAGLKAILAGIPTFCHLGASYSGACKTDVAKIESEYTIPCARWEDTLNRICYGQWNVEELSSGEAWRFVREQSRVFE